MRWLIRKVVKLIIEALLELDEFDRVVDKIASKIAVTVAPVGSQPEKARVATSEYRDDIDSSRALADVIISGTDKVEMSEISDEDAVISSGEGRGDVMDMLKGIGD